VSKSKSEEAMAKRASTVRNCGNCRWASWEMTEKGNPRKSIAGKCTYPIPDLPPMPYAVIVETPRKRLVWANKGADCPTFSEKAKSSPSDEMACSASSLLSEAKERLCDASVCNRMGKPAHSAGYVRLAMEILAKAEKSLLGLPGNAKAQPPTRKEI